MDEPCFSVHKPVYRFTVLAFNCMLTFGSYYCFDMPSVLQDQLQANQTSNTTCSDCLQLTGSQYNLLYAIYAWTNAVVVIVAGFLIDKCGNRFGAFLFSGLCVIGSSIFALGVTVKSSTSYFYIMLIGRLIFGAGNGSLTIVQNRITSFWFSKKELALAFGFTLAFSRLGSVLNFFLTNKIYRSVGLEWTLWIGAILCIFGFLAALIVGYLDVRGMRELGLSDRAAMESKKVQWSDIKYFSASFWLLVLTIMFFYNGVFPFVADASKFIKDKYGYSDDTSAYMAGAVYDVSMILSPFLGGIIDKFGKRGILSVGCAVFTIPVFGFLAFTNLHPLISTLWLGVTYSVAAASLWPSIPLVISQATIGTAMGLTTSVQMIGIGVSNVIVGEMLGKNQNLPKDETLRRWKYVMIYLLANALACVATSICLNINDKRKGGILNKSRQERSLEEEDEEEEINETKPLLESASID